MKGGGGGREDNGPVGDVIHHSSSPILHLLPTERVNKPPPRAAAAAAEKVEAVVVAGLPVSSKALRFPQRPGLGQAGMKCIVKANHFLAQLPDKDLHQYDVCITPEVTSKSVNRAIMGQLVKMYRDTELGRRLPVYDGRKSLYTAGLLPFTSKEFTIALAGEDEGNGASSCKKSIEEKAIQGVYQVCSASRFTPFRAVFSW